MSAWIRSLWGFQTQVVNRFFQGWVQFFYVEMSNNGPYTTVGDAKQNPNIELMKLMSTEIHTPETTETSSNVRDGKIRVSSWL